MKFNLRLLFYFGVCINFLGDWTYRFGILAFSIIVINSGLVSGLRRLRSDLYLDGVFCCFSNCICICSYTNDCWLTSTDLVILDSCDLFIELSTLWLGFECNENAPGLGTGYFGSNFYREYITIFKYYLLSF